MDKFVRNTIMPSQQGPPQQSGLSLPLQHSIHCIRCGATTNFNVKYVVYNCRQPTRIFVCEVQNEIFYAIFSNWWHIEIIWVFQRILFGKPGNEKSHKFPGILETGIPVSKPYCQPIAEHPNSGISNLFWRFVSEARRKTCKDSKFSYHVLESKLIAANLPRSSRCSPVSCTFRFFFLPLGPNRQRRTEVEHLWNAIANCFARNLPCQNLM